MWHCLLFLYEESYMLDRHRQCVTEYTILSSRYTKLLLLRHFYFHLFADFSWIFRQQLTAAGISTLLLIRGDQWTLITSNYMHRPLKLTNTAPHWKLLNWKKKGSNCIVQTMARTKSRIFIYSLDSSVLNWVFHSSYHKFVIYATHSYCQ